MDAIECIMKRHSTRHFSERDIEKDALNTILKAAIAAPSGKNGQPWKFRVVTDDNTIKRISDKSKYHDWMEKAKIIIAVFLDTRCSYDYIKDVQSCGASIQNMLLSATSLNIGSCWIGELLGKENEIKTVLNIGNENLKMMGIVLLGYEEKPHTPSGRKSINSFLI